MCTTWLFSEILNLLLRKSNSNNKYLNFFFFFLKIFFKQEKKVFPEELGPILEETQAIIKDFGEICSF